MPIYLAPLNKEMRVVRVSMEGKVKKHLESLGITLGSKITILSSSSGNTIVVVKEGRLALDREIASKIFVA